MAQGNAGNPCGMSGATKSSTWLPAASPPGGHQQGVVEEVIGAADGEERRGQPTEVGEDRGDGRIADVPRAWCPGGSTRRTWRCRRGSSMSGPSVASHPPLARRQPPVEDPEHEVGAVDPVGGMELVADPQQHRSRHVATGRLAPDGATRLGAEVLGGVVEQPGGHRDAVVGARRVGVLGGEPVVDDMPPPAGGRGTARRWPGSFITGAPRIIPPPWKWRYTAVGGAVGDEHPTRHPGDLAVDPRHPRRRERSGRTTCVEKKARSCRSVGGSPCPANPPLGDGLHPRYAHDGTPRRASASKPVGTTVASPCPSPGAPPRRRAGPPTGPPGRRAGTGGGSGDQGADPSRIHEHHQQTDDGRR